MAAQRKHEGPYRVIRVSTHINGGIYEVVEWDKETDSYIELRPTVTYFKRQSAYAKCVRMNQRWQKQQAEN